MRPKASIFWHETKFLSTGGTRRRGRMLVHLPPGYVSRSQILPNILGSSAWSHHPRRAPLKERQPALERFQPALENHYHQRLIELHESGIRLKSREA